MILLSLGWFFTGLVIASAVACFFLALRNLKWGLIAVAWQGCYWFPIGIPAWYEGEYIDLYQSIWPAGMLILCRYLFSIKPMWVKVLMGLFVANMGLHAVDETLYRLTGNELDLFWYNTMMDLGNKLEFIALFISGGRWAWRNADGLDVALDHVRARTPAGGRGLRG